MDQVQVPRLRGVLHLVAAPIALIGGLVLVVAADAGSIRWAVGIFMVTSVALFTTSAIYHMGKWLPKTKAMLRRADHSNIFLIIAGTYTPLALLLLPASDARTLLIIVWSGAIAGVLIRNFWLTAPRWIYVPIYVALGWAADLRKDLRWCLSQGRTSELLHAARIRWARRSE